MITLLYLVFPDVLNTVGEMSYGIWMGLIELDIVFTIFLFIYLFMYLLVPELQHLLLFIYLCIYWYLS